MSTFNALVATKEAGKITSVFQQISREQLPAGDVLVRVSYSTLNYKDGLAVTGQPGIMRKFPMVPGIDFSGVVEESSTEAFKPGESVVGTGFGMGETIWGGYSQYVRVPSEHLVGLPAGLTLEEAMGIGTAGFTAMQCVLALESHGLTPEAGEVVVTGASGGVGGIAIVILSKLGHRVFAATGRPEQEPYLRSLGAAGIVDRAAIDQNVDKGLGTERWAGAIDTIGGKTLSGLFAEMASRSSVAACGMAGGPAIATSVWPFILRGVNLLGVSSMKVTVKERREVWRRLSMGLSISLLDSMIQVEPLSRIHELGQQILDGKTRGRIVVDVNR
jgi:acrylyl-CoA reductase (NADPH)